MSSLLKKHYDHCSKNYGDYVDSMVRFAYAPSLPTNWGFKQKTWMPAGHYRSNITQPGFLTPFEPAAQHDYKQTMSAKQAGITIAVLAGSVIAAPLYHYMKTFSYLRLAIHHHWVGKGQDHIYTALANAGKNIVQIAFMPVFYTIELVKEVLAFIIRSAITYMPPVVKAGAQCVNGFFTQQKHPPVERFSFIDAYFKEGASDNRDFSIELVIS